nr:glycosyltransferase family 4 protein [uncultured Sphingomonas sp.]
MSGGLGEGRRILVLCPYPFDTNAGQRLKFEQYYDNWRSLGFEIVISPFMDWKMWSVVFEPGHFGAKVAGTLRGYFRRVRDLFRLRHYDLVYSFMWVTPVGPPLFEWLVLGLARRVVFDLEDSVLDSKGGSGGNPNPLLRLLRGAGKARLLVRRADHVIASSPELADRCGAENHRGAATYITSSVDTDRFVPVNRYSNDHVPVIGWTGTFSSRAYLDLLRPVFQALARERRFNLRVIGNFDYELPGVDLEVLRWSAEEEVAQLQGIDIGVYPLPLGDESWVSGKSGLKAIQYMAFALPCVATATGNTPRVVRDGVSGLLVRTEAEWLEALKRLIDDPALRRRLGQNARQDVLDRYSKTAVALSYRQVLVEALGA